MEIANIKRLLFAVGLTLFMLLAFLSRITRAEIYEIRGLDLRYQWGCIGIRLAEKNKEGELKGKKYLILAGVLQAKFEDKTTSPYIIKRWDIEEGQLLDADQLIQGALHYQLSMNIETDKSQRAYEKTTCVSEYKNGKYTYFKPVEFTIANQALKDKNFKNSETSGHNQSASKKNRKKHYLTLQELGINNDDILKNQDLYAIEKIMDENNQEKFLCKQPKSEQITTLKIPRKLKIPFKNTPSQHKKKKAHKVTFSEGFRPQSLEKQKKNKNYSETENHPTLTQTLNHVHTKKKLDEKKHKRERSSDSSSSQGSQQSLELNKAPSTAQKKEDLLNLYYAALLLCDNDLIPPHERAKTIQNHLDIEDAKEYSISENYTFAFGTKDGLLIVFKSKVYSESNPNPLLLSILEQEDEKNKTEDTASASTSSRKSSGSVILD